jgi:feruloyl esterase
MRRSGQFLAGLVLLLAATGDAGAAAVSCESLAAVSLPNTTIALAQTVAAGAFIPPGGLPAGGNPYAQLPAFCRVAGVIAPTTDSYIQFEVWMPVSNWNGKFQGIGNGGLAGAISYSDMAPALGTGYATASTDTGHTGGFATGAWALGHPEKVTDYGNRGVHEMTVQSQALVNAYYGKPAQHSYWNGCSNGGQEGLSEAQRYPADYDGILAGAPANYFTHLQVGGVWIAQAILEDPATYVPLSAMAPLNAAVLAACDALDGVTDGVINDPRQCNFDIATLECSGANRSNCLTAAQIGGLKKIYEGPSNPRTGEQIYPGHMLGSELGWAGWIIGSGTPPNNTQLAIADSTFQYLVFQDPAWDWTTFDFDQNVAFADGQVGYAINQTNPDLRPFRELGHKLIQYQGWSDPAISPVNSVNYYTSVLATMGALLQMNQDKAAGDTANYYRLFMIPGMGHCSGGPGTDTFDKVGVLDAWVVNGKAPDSIIASHLTNGKVDRTRPLCPYPQVAKWTGSGSTDAAANFVCVAPPATEHAPFRRP